MSCTLRSFYTSSPNSLPLLLLLLLLLLLSMTRHWQIRLLS
jgi:hypothetical protein